MHHLRLGGKGGKGHGGERDDENCTTYRFPGKHVAVAWLCLRAIHPTATILRVFIPVPALRKRPHRYITISAIPTRASQKVTKPKHNRRITSPSHSTALSISHAILVFTNGISRHCGYTILILHPFNRKAKGRSSPQVWNSSSQIRKQNRFFGLLLVACVYCMPSHDRCNHLSVSLFLFTPQHPQLFSLPQPIQETQTPHQESHHHRSPTPQ